MKRAATEEFNDRDDVKRTETVHKRELLKHWRSLPADIRALVVPFAVRAPQSLVLARPLNHGHMVDSSTGLRFETYTSCSLDYWMFAARVKERGVVLHKCGCRAFGWVRADLCFWHALEAEREQAFFAAE